MQGIAPSADAQYNGVPLDAPPSVRQGYGRVDLGRALPLASSGPGWNLQVQLEAMLAPQGLTGLYAALVVSTRAARCRWPAPPQAGTRQGLETLAAHVFVRLRADKEQARCSSPAPPPLEAHAAPACGPCSYPQSSCTCMQTECCMISALRTL